MLPLNSRKAQLINNQAKNRLRSTIIFIYLNKGHLFICKILIYNKKWIKIYLKYLVMVYLKMKISKYLIIFRI